MKSKSFEIALSAVSAALAIIFLTLGAYVPVFDLASYMFSSVALMLPLAKGFYLGGFLAYLAAGLLTLLISGGNFVFILPYAVFFGLHALVNALAHRYKINKIVAVIVKIIWFDLSLYLMFEFTQMFVTTNEFIQNYIIKYIYIAIPVLGSVFFILYDFLITRAQTTVNIFVEKYKK